MTDKNPLAHYSGVLSEAEQATQSIEVTDGMAMTFHHAITDAAIGQDDLNEIKIGLQAALANVTAPQAAPAAVAVPDAVRDAEKLLRAEAARLDRLYGMNKWYGFCAEKASCLEHLRVADALAATPAAAAPKMNAEAVIAAPIELLERVIDSLSSFAGTKPHTEADMAVWEQLNNLLSAAAAPVVLPEPVGAMSATTPRVVAWNCTFMPEAGTRLYTDQQVRALLAGVSAPAAQAVASIYVTADGQRECDDWKMPLPIGRNLLYTAPQAQADARDAQLLAFAVSEIRRDEMTDSELLDAMEQKRIAVVPEYEGPWDAEIYNDEGKPNHRGSGSTPREAIRAAIAAQAAQQGGAA